MYPKRYNKSMDQIEIELYETATGKRPFELWMKQIKEIHTRAKILTRLDRLKLGNFGDCKTLQEGVCELRIHYGPGIRIYYGRFKNKVILLLCGGDKDSQDRDIAKQRNSLKGDGLWQEVKNIKNSYSSI
jgi:putative addiction module killer protein